MKGIVPERIFSCSKHRSQVISISSPVRTLNIIILPYPSEGMLNNGPSKYIKGKTEQAK